MDATLGLPSQHGPIKTASEGERLHHRPLPAPLAGLRVQPGKPSSWPMGTEYPSAIWGGRRLLVSTGLSLAEASSRNRHAASPCKWPSVTGTPKSMTRDAARQVTTHEWTRRWLGHTQRRDRDGDYLVQPSLTHCLHPRVHVTMYTVAFLSMEGVPPPSTYIVVGMYLCM